MRLMGQKSLFMLLTRELHCDRDDINISTLCSLQAHTDDIQQ